MLVVDGSGSIRENNVNNWQLVVNFIHDLVNRLQIGPNANQVGSVLFGNSARKLWGLNKFTDKNNLLTRVNNMINDYNNIGEQTNITGGLNLMMSGMFNTPEDRSKFPNVAIVITDGKATYHRSSVIKVANNAKMKGVQIFAVGVTNDVDEAELRGMSSPPQEKGHNYFLVANFEALSTIVMKLSERLC